MSLFLGMFADLQSDEVYCFILTREEGMNLRISGIMVLLASMLLGGCGSDGNRNHPPVAHAGTDQNVVTGTLVTLDGSASSDRDGNPLNFTWHLVDRPEGSSASLSSSTAVRPTFTADRDGVYLLALVVSDGHLDSLPDQVVLTAATANSAPVAAAGLDQNVTTGTLINLNASASSDANGDPLSYRWSLESRPEGSDAVLSSTTVVDPAFTADRDGIYVAQLIVSDGQLDSLPDQVVITAATANSAPVANAGTGQSVTTGTLVSLDGSASSDADGDLLTYLWSLISRPEGSDAALSFTTAVDPTFTADRDGIYVIQLIVRDNLVDSDPVSVTISATTPTPPSLILTGTWSQPAYLEAFGTEAGEPAVTVGADGRGTVVWLQELNQVHASQFSPGDGWGGAEFVAGIPSPPEGGPAVAVDASGNALVAWQAPDGTSTPLRYSFRASGGNWQGSSTFDADWWGGIGPAAPPKLVMNATGRGLALWHQITPSSYGWYQNLWLRTFDAAVGQWSDPGFNLNYSNLGGPAGEYYENSFDPQIAMNDSGSAVVVWKRTAGYYGVAPPALKAMVYDASGSQPVWRGLTRLDTEEILPSRVKAVIDAAGNATVVWLQEVEGVNNLYFSRLAAGGSSWSPASLLENGDGAIDGFDLAVDGDGNILVVWDQVTDSTPRFFFSRFAAGGGSWSPPASAIDNARHLAVGVDRDGRGVAVWRGHGEYGIYASRYNPASSGPFWTLPERLNGSPPSAGNPQIAVNLTGSSFVVWIQHDGEADSVFSTHLEPASR
ncbi:MAG: PKD domain-containing protein [Desulfuromonadales bacterium]|nr:PKD domain-containing protein [Desulfuromonadales bacterium]